MKTETVNHGSTIFLLIKHIKDTEKKGFLFFVFPSNTYWPGVIKIFMESTKWQLYLMLMQNT